MGAGPLKLIRGCILSVENFKNTNKGPCKQFKHIISDKIPVPMEITVPKDTTYESQSNAV